MFKESCKIYKTVLFYTNKQKLKTIDKFKICECSSKCERNEFSMSKYYTAVFSYNTSVQFWKRFEKNKT